MTNEELVTKIQNKEDVTENMLALWQQNKGIIGNIAYKYSQYEDIEDLKQQGYIELCRAAEHYKPDMGVAFVTYATNAIQRNIARYVENCGRLVRVPNGTMKAVAEYNTLTADMLARCGRKPTDEEACQFLDITNEQLQRTHKAIQFKNIKSLNIPLSDGTELELCELISADTDVEGEVLDVVELQELKSLLWDMVARLPTGQAQIIESRYIDNKTVREISSETGESETDVKREEKRALHTLSHCKGSNRLVSFLPECVEYSEGLKGTSVKTFNRTWTSATERVSIQLAKCR